MMLLEVVVLLMSRVRLSRCMKFLFVVERKPQRERTSYNNSVVTIKPRVAMEEEDKSLL